MRGYWLQGLSRPLIRANFLLRRGSSFATMTTNEAEKTTRSSPAEGKPTKLHGRAFYESIGSPKFIVAPMVDQSEFVCICAPH
jgi:tRNA-dihydrouridine synthase 1